MKDANNLPEVKKYPPDVKLMEKWFGFKCKTKNIESFYKNGGAGTKIKKALQ